jgi:hypothetical protein
VGRTYSVNGYINAVLQRTSSTLLVEGTTDKEAMHHLVAERTPASSRQCNIDHSAIFNDISLSGQGAKAKVLKVTAEIQHLHILLTASGMDCRATPGRLLRAGPSLNNRHRPL